MQHHLVDCHKALTLRTICQNELYENMFCMKHPDLEMHNHKNNTKKITFNRLHIRLSWLYWIFKKIH